MKKTLFVLAIAIILCGSAWAEDVLVTVINPEPYRLWYVLDPPDFAGVLPDSPDLVDRAAAFLTAEGQDFPFDSLEPGQEVVFAGLPDGLHYLFGFFESDLLDDLPVQLMAFEVDSSAGDFGFEVLSIPELFMVSRGIGRLAGLPDALIALAQEQATAEAEVVAEEPVVEEAVVEEAVVEEAVVEEAVVEEAVVEEAVVEEAVVEEAVVEEDVDEEPVVEEPVVEEAVVEEAVVEAPPAPEVLASFSEYYDPVYFTRESRDGFIVLPIASSRAWGKPGTRLSLFSGFSDQGTITLTLRSEAGFAPNVSFFFYAFPERIVGKRSEFTFEARPDAGGRSLVVLWQEGKSTPRLVGTARTEGGEFAWTVSVSDLPMELVAEFGPSTTFDLTTAWLDEASGTWEEFYFTTFAVADLTR
jgi:hypothetical protein